MDDGNSHKSSSVEENASLLSGADSGSFDAMADSEKNIRSVEEPTKNNHDDIDQSIKQNDDYYEVISADGSIGGEDIDENDIENGNSCSNSTFQNEQCSFLDLPFVPKFDFPNEVSKSASVDSNSFHFNPAFGAHNYVNQCYTTPNVLPQFDFSKPPPNLNFTANPPTTCFVDSASEINLNLTPQGQVGFGIISSKHISAISNNSNSASSVILSKDHKSSPSSTLTQAAKAPIVDWLDENGDPIKGAFDNIPIHVNEEADAAKNSKVEYVFSVKEKKKFSVSSDFSDVVSTSSLINTNVLLKNVAGNVSIDSSTSNPKIYEEEKKLFLASKSGEEYKAAILSNTPSTSAEATAVPSGKTLSVNENAKKERYNRFRRNRFTDKKDDPVPETVPKEEPKKTQEEVALER